MSTGLCVRDSAPGDVPRIVEIYAHEVLHGLATFEEVPPSVEEMARRRGEVLAHGLPWLVAEREGRVLGYAYAGLYRARPAYRNTVEDSVYVAQDARGQGIGRALLGALIARCESGRHRQMIAVIGDSANHGSIELHRSLGFTDVGTLKAVGFKHDQWVDTVFMQRALGSGSGSPQSGTAHG